MPTPNYALAKSQRDRAKKRKQEEKRQRRAAAQQKTPQEPLPGSPAGPTANGA